MCWNANHDGAGFMYSEENKLIVKRGYMKYKRFKDSYLRHEDKEMVIHFRWASCGIISPNTCHPFKINENLAVVHNGHINVPFVLSKKESDSLWIVKNILTKFPKDFLNKSAYTNLISIAIEGSVLVFMDNFGNVTKIGERSGSFTSSNKCWFSNRHWMVDMVDMVDIGNVVNKKEIIKKDKNKLSEVKFYIKGIEDEIAKSYLQTKI
jgi:predicted glutamine amidotransferase